MPIIAEQLESADDGDDVVDGVWETEVAAGGPATASCSTGSSASAAPSSTGIGPLGDHSPAGSTRAVCSSGSVVVGWCGSKWAVRSPVKDSASSSMTPSPTVEQSPSKWSETSKPSDSLASASSRIAIADGLGISIASAGVQIPPDAGLHVDLSLRGSPLQGPCELAAEVWNDACPRPPQAPPRPRQRRRHYRPRLRLGATRMTICPAQSAEARR